MGRHPVVQGLWGAGWAQAFPCVVTQEQAPEGSESERHKIQGPVGGAVTRETRVERSLHSWEMAKVEKEGLADCSQCCAKGPSHSLVGKVMLLQVPNVSSTLVGKSDAVAGSQSVFRLPVGRW